MAGRRAEFLFVAAQACLLSALACTPTPEPQPSIVCSATIDGCDCGQIGCSCGDDLRCEQGTCDEHSATCVLEQDGMVHVPAGWFSMGCNPAVDPLGDAYPDVPNIPRECGDESNPGTPYRPVYLDGYWLDRTEVSKAQYRACINAGVCTAPLEWDLEYQDEENVSRPTPEDYPAGGLTWSQARTYCEWAGKRLPTEAEWEKAARGSDGRKYPWGNEPEPDCSLATHIWMSPDGAVGCSDKKMTAVGSLLANTSPYGAVDMAGNVQEWALDASAPGDGYESLPDMNPVRLEGTERISRGCSYQCPTVAAGGWILRTSYRLTGGPDTTWEYLSQGVRCARNAEDQPLVGR